MQAVAPVHLETGQVIGEDFRIEGALSEGGMGAVYVATQISTRRRRALKVMHAQLVPDERSRLRFAEEATVGSTIPSEHVVEVIAAGVDGPTGMPWLAMELLDGVDLQVHVERTGPLSSGAVREIFHQLGHALAAAHRRGIVHRDLKPENLFLAESRRSDGGTTLKILDFGIAKTVEEAKTAVTVTTAIGSPLWMAPEQGTAGASLRPSTDVWALGLVAFYLLTSKSYWSAANMTPVSLQALLVDVMVNPIVPASRRARELGYEGQLPRDFDKWFARCVCRAPGDRFADAGTAVAALDAVLAEDVPLAASRGAPDRTAQVANRDGLTARLDEDIARRLSLEESPQAPALVGAARSRQSVALIVVAGAVALASLGAAAVWLTDSSSAHDETDFGADASGATGAIEIVEPTEEPSSSTGQTSNGSGEVTTAGTQPGEEQSSSGTELTAEEPTRASSTPRSGGSTGQISNGSGGSTTARTTQPGEERGSSGTELTSDQVRAVVSRERAGVQRCYETVARQSERAPSLRLDVDVTVGPSGTVTRAVVRGPAFGDVNECVERTVRRWRFPRTGAESRISIPFVFWGRAASAQAPNVPTGGTTQSGEERGSSGTELTSDQVRAVVSRERAGVQRCYETVARQSERAPSLRLDVDVTVGPSGTVTRAVVRGPAFGDVSECVERTVRRWRFPQAGAESRISIPFVFTGRE